MHGYFLLKQDRKCGVLGATAYSYSHTHTHTHTHTLTYVYIKQNKLVRKERCWVSGHVLVEPAAQDAEKEDAEKEVLERNLEK